MIRTVICDRDSERRRMMTELWYFSLSGLEEIQFHQYEDLSVMMQELSVGQYRPDLLIIELPQALAAEEALLKFIHDRPVRPELILCNTDKSDPGPVLSEAAYAILKAPLSTRELVRTATEFRRMKNMDNQHSVQVLINGSPKVFSYRRIHYFESNARKITAYMEEDDKSSFYMKISDLAAKIDSPLFIRCHQRYLVNRDYIDRLDSHSLILKDKTTIPISKRYYKDVRQQLTHRS